MKKVSTPHPGIGNTHLAGEFFVAAELSKRGYCVAMTMGNAKAIDLVAEKDSKPYMLQVKALASPKSSGWPLNMDKSKIKDDVFYIVVILNDLTVPPTYYVLPPTEVRRLGRWGDKRAILYIGDVKKNFTPNDFSALENAA